VISCNDEGTVGYMINRLVVYKELLEFQRIFQSCIHELGVQ
jgi:hypothetical protein